MTVATRPKKLMRFKLLRGRHTEGQGELRDIATGKVIRKNTLKRYMAKKVVTGKDPNTGEPIEKLIPHDGYGEDSDIIETTTDLIAKFGGNHVKYERMADPEQSVELDESDDDELSGMTVTELREFAEGNEIDLGEASLKADIVSQIKSAMQVA